ncbi:MAG: LysM peptidoglycan-binding domain-containing protein, partial [Deltaproteobacteria bacterium]|nr:LysM peptidoglycan-binding domain-containing protein [Deltaproteobacteria bacterium]
LDMNDPDLNGCSAKGKDRNQALLDAALEKCEKANQLYEKGKIEDAIETLDKAYIMVLEVNKDAEQSILQQREDLRFSITKQITKIYTSRFNVANGYNKAIPLVMNADVKKAIEAFQGSQRSFFMDTYARSGQYRPMMVKALKAEGLPEEISWLPFIESGYKLRALSCARALGMWQFIASTGYKFGLERNEWIDERMDPKKSTKAAIAYLKELHGMFGDWSTALAAYNCGEGTVLRVIRTQNVNYLDNFWDLYRRLPQETASYFPQFLAVLHIVSNPRKYGFTLPAVDRELTYEEVAIERQVHLGTIAQTIGVSVDSIKDLNPDLRRDVTPPDPYTLKVPQGKAKVLMANLSDIPLWVPSSQTYAVHKVRKGDSVSTLAVKYKTSEKAIMAMNKIKPDKPLVAGTRLKLPASRTLASTNVQEPIHSKVIKDNLIEYVVKQGDTIWTIADKHNTSAKVIQSLNQLSSTSLMTGQVLQITARPDTLKKRKTATHTVQKGDFPGKIAKRYNMTLDELLKINKLSRTALLKPGQTLVVKTKQ